MNALLQIQRLAGIFKIALVFLTGVLIVPFLIGLYHHTAPAEILGLVVSILILQPFAVVVGLGLGIGPLPLLLIMASFGITVIFVLFGICDAFAKQSEWLRSHIEKIAAIAEKSGLVKKYGIYTLILFIWIPGVGLYGCVLIAWLFHWRGARPAGIIFAGWMLATALVLLTTLEVMEIIF